MARVITVSAADRDLFHVAARYLLDATQWWRIAIANGISDPAIAGVTTLVIPAIDASQTGGVPPQS